MQFRQAPGGILGVQMFGVELVAWGILSGCMCHSTVCTAPAGLVQEHAAEVDSIAVITGYKAQERALRAKFADEPGLRSISSVYFGTVDGFQVSTPGSALMHASAGPYCSPVPATSKGNLKRAEAQGNNSWADGA